MWVFSYVRVKFNTVFVFLSTMVNRTLDDLPCQYTSSQAILKLSQSVREHVHCDEIVVTSIRIPVRSE